MDALGFDVYHRDYQDKVMEAQSEMRGDQRNSEELEAPESNETDYVGSDLASGTTVPVRDEGETRGSERDDGGVSKPSSSSSSSSSEQRSFGSASLYQPEFLAPRINYDRDNQQQKLIAVIGREFDQPGEIASNMQKLVLKQPDCDFPVAKFVPFTLKRKVLLKGSFDSRELKQHDLICMCYNASEARILLTGADGFYTSLLRHVEALLGPNKVSFLISNYTPPSGILEPVAAGCAPSLKARLYKQAPLRGYLDNGQVFSWNDTPLELHANRLIELANSEPNPHNIFSTAMEQCCLL